MSQIKFSCTSNNVKLFKHLDILSDLQFGKVTPIMVHTMPTHRCQLNCAYCCFKNREDKTLDLSFDKLTEGILQFYSIGTRAVEITGGGDPTLYPYINEYISFLHKLGMKIGVNTNGIDYDKVECWEYCDWVRLSLNVLDYLPTVNVEGILKSGTTVTFCYIWNEMSTKDIFDNVISIANSFKIPCRVAPDCIVPVKSINDNVDMLRELLAGYKNNQYVFLSDFNIDTIRPNTDCRIFMIKPCLYTDGNVYACPSSELAVENKSKIFSGSKICRYDEVKNFYSSAEALQPKKIECSYCKYVKQQIVLEDVLTETTFNEFA